MLLPLEWRKEHGSKAKQKKVIICKSQCSMSEVAKKRGAASILPSVKVANGLEQQAKLRPAGRLALRNAEGPPNLENQLSQRPSLSAKLCEAHKSSKV